MTDSPLKSLDLKRTTGSGILMLNTEMLSSQRLSADLKSVLRLHVDDRWWCHQEHLSKCQLRIQRNFIQLYFPAVWSRLTQESCLLLCFCVFMCVFCYFCFYVFVSFCDIVCFLCLSQFLCIFVVFCVFLAFFFCIFFCVFWCIFDVSFYIFWCIFCELVGKQISTYTWIEDESRPRTQTTSSSGADPDKGTFPRHFSLTFFLRDEAALLLRSFISQRIMYVY